MFEPPFYCNLLRVKSRKYANTLWYFLGNKEYPEIYILHSNTLKNESPNIFVQSNLTRTNTQIYSYCKIETNKCPSKYLRQIYLNFRIFKYIHHILISSWRNAKSPAFCLLAGVSSYGQLLLWKLHPATGQYSVCFWLPSLRCHPEPWYLTLFSFPSISLKKCSLIWDTLNLEEWLCFIFKKTLPPRKRTLNMICRRLVDVDYYNRNIIRVFVVK